MDERFKFIRSKDPFQGLPDYKDAPYFRLNNKTLYIPIQLSMFNGETIVKKQTSEKQKESDLRVGIGNFFELISHGMYGGKIKSIYKEKVKNLDDMLRAEPDITDTKRGIFRESKGFLLGRELKLTDQQISKYILLQTKEHFKNPPRIIFEIFRHKLRGVQRDYVDKGKENLIEALSNSVNSFISLPFSIIFEAYLNKDNTKTKRFTSRHDNEYTYDPLTRLNSSALNHFIAYPEETLNEFGLNPDNFEIKKKRFPRTVTITGFNINPFPMLFIHDKNYNSFIDGLVERVNSDKDLSERVYKFTKGLIGEIEETSEEGLFKNPMSDDEVPF